MRITARQFGEAIVLTVHGPVIGVEASELLKSTVQRQVVDSIRMVVLNLTQVEAIDAGGLRALFAIAGAMRRASGCVRLAGVSDRMSNLTVTWLMTTFSTFETVEDAVDDVRRAMEDAALVRAQPSERRKVWLGRLRHLRGRNRTASVERQDIEPLKTRGPTSA